jgi:uncharacterized membrane protein
VIVAGQFQNTDHSRITSAALAIWVFVATLAVVVFIAVIAAPVLSSQGHTGTARTIYHAFSYLCHQIPERSFHLAGNKFAVCSRCTGLYAGFAIAVLAYPLARSVNRTDTPSLLWLILAALPLAIDFSLGYFNIWSNTQISRFATGALLSSVAVFYIVPGLVELTMKVLIPAPSK